MNNPHDNSQPAAAARFDGGNLDCGNGLLLLIRKHIDPLAGGELLEICSSNKSVREDLPAWCRLTGNQLVAQYDSQHQTRYLVSKGTYQGPAQAGAAPGQAGAPARGEPAVDRERTPMPITQPLAEVVIPADLPRPAPADPLPELAVTGIGSWPRPRWLLESLHAHLEGRLSEAEFQETADDAVRLVVAAQQRAGVDLLSDGEQRRDDYASFVGGRLDNCQLIPITDLLPYVDHPRQFAAALRKLDVPAEKVRHPAVYGPLGRSRPLAAHELAFVRQIAPQPVKVALPGPYLLTRTMWMECISDRAYARREALADDVVRTLREEVHALLAGGAALVQLDEPVLTEVVYGRPDTGNRTFMCGALGAKGPPAEELEFAEHLLNRVVAGLPRERLALHVCRGNWTTDPSAALQGDYQPLLGLLSRVHVGTLFLECCTARAGELSVLAALPDQYRVGVGVVDQKSSRIETAEELVSRGERAVQLLGRHRVLLNPDCGFATFADNPIAPATIAEAKLRALAAAADTLRRRHHLPR